MYGENRNGNFDPEEEMTQRIQESEEEMDQMVREPEEEMTRMNSGQEDETYYYNSQRYEAPRWQPDPEKYNTGYNRPPQKKKRRWVVPLIVVVAVLVAAIVVGVTAGSGFLNRTFNRSLMAEAAETSAALEVSDNANLSADTAANANANANNVVWADVDSTDTTKSGIVITDVSDVIDEVFPAVVSITSRTIINDSDYYDFFFGYQGSPYGNQENNSREVDSGIGSGTIIGQNDEELLILTSNHVVNGASSLAITFVNGTAVDGVVKSASPDTDIAIVSVKLSDIDNDTMSAIRTAKLSTKPAEMGEGVIVIGNAMGYGMSVTSGIVSAVDRELQVEGSVLHVIQTDAAINQGNSGGCMLNANGEVIGISEAKIIVTGVEGMCYAIPIANNAELIQSLLEEETPETESEDDTNAASGAYLGIRGRDITAELAESYGMPQGVYVISIVPGGGAEAAGIEDGDIITAMDGQDTSTMSKLQYELTKHSEGDVVEVTVMREDGGKYVQAVLEVTLTGQIS
jgi:serine protease Do